MGIPFVGLADLLSSGAPSSRPSYSSELKLGTSGGWVDVDVGAKVGLGGVGSEFRLLTVLSAGGVRCTTSKSLTSGVLAAGFGVLAVGLGGGTGSRCLPVLFLLPRFF